MKKLALVLVVAMAGAFVASAEEAEALGIEIGTDITAGSVLSETAFSVSPYVSYSTTLAEVDFSFILGYDATITPAFSSDDIYFELDASKGFSLSDTMTLSPSVAITNLLYLADSSYELDIEPGVSLEAGISSTTISFPMVMPVGAATELSLGLYAEEAVALGDLGLSAYLDYAIVPTAALSDIGVCASYPLGPVAASLTAEFSGFDTTLDMGITLSVAYAF